VGSGGVIIDQGAANTVILDAARSIVNGGLTILTGKLDLSTYTINRSTSGGTLSLANATTLRIGGTNTFPSNYSTHSINAGSTVEYYGTAQTVATLNSSQSYGNLILSTSGNKTLPTPGELGIAGTLTVSGAAVVVPGAGTVNLNGTAQNVTGTMTFNNLTLSGSGSKALTTTQTVNGILSMEGPAVVTLAAAITMGTSSTLQYKGTESRTTGNEFPATYNSTGGVIIDQSAGNTVTLYANKIIQNGLLNIKSGTLDLSTYTINRSTPGGSLTIASGASLRIGGTNSLPSNYSTHSFDINSTVIFNGSAAQSIGGSSSTTFGNLTIDNSSGATLNFNQTVNGILTLSNGLLNTGSNTLTVDCSGSIASANDTRYVNGKLAMVFCNTGARVFPIGKGVNYRPLTLNYKVLTDTSTVTAEQIESTLPGTIPSDITLFGSRYWQLSQTGGSSYSFILTLDGTDCSPNSYLKMLKGDSVTNAHYAVTTPNYTNTTAFTSFGNFGLGQLNCVTWLGTTNNWYTPSNWTSGTLPTSTDDIRIPSAVSFFPSIISGSDISIASAGKLQVLDSASLTLESGPLLTFQPGATVSTGAYSKIVLKSDARYLNLSSSTPTLEVQRQLTGAKGWRMLSSPVATTFSDMFKSPLETQGFTGTSITYLQPNILWWLESDGGTSLQSWRAPAKLTDSLTPGGGYFHYVFNGAERLDANGDSSGTYYGDVLPITMSATGVEKYNGIGAFGIKLTYTTKASTQTPSSTDKTYYDLDSLDQGWNLIGNPTASTLNWDANGWSRTNVDNTIYVWDPSALSGNGDYLTWNGTTGTLGSGRIAPFQAFWTHAIDSTTLSFTNDVKTDTSGTFLRSAQADETISIPITLSLGDLQTTSFISFSENGVKGPDRWDGYRLEPMSDNWLELYTLSSQEHVSPLVINHLPMLKDELITIPLYYDAQIINSGSRNNYTLNWTLPDNWPTDWKISLQDHQAEEAISMTEQSSYSYSTVSKRDLTTAAGQFPLPQRLVKSLSSPTPLRSSSSSQPFTIVISKGTNIDYMAPKPQLLGNYPNPFKKITTIRFSLPQKAKVHVDIYSSQGRKITTFADGLYPAGVAELPWDAMGMAPGMYFIQFISGDTAETKKSILIK